MAMRSRYERLLGEVCETDGKVVLTIAIALLALFAVGELSDPRPLSRTHIADEVPNPMPLGQKDTK